MGISDIFKKKKKAEPPEQTLRTVKGGKWTPISAEEKARLERNRRDAAQQRLNESRRLAKEAKRVREEYNRQAQYNKQLKQTTQQAELEGQKARREHYIARQRQMKAQRPSALKTIGAGVITGIKTMKRSSRPSRQRSVYVSTSHGLKKITPSDPMYNQYAAQQGAPSVQPTRAIEKDDDWGTPSAFSSL